MMRLFELLSQALLVSRRDQEQATKPPSAPGHMPLDHLAQPLPNFMPRGNHSYDAVLSPDVDTVFADIKWTKDAIQTTRAFNAAIRDSRFRTLAEIIDTVVPNCGVSKTSGKSVNVTGMSTMVWQNDKTREGFTHHGPCEAWIDKTRIYQAPNCRVNHTAYPATIPIDYSVCGGKCIFKFYWLALDESEWHAYKQCVPISTRTKTFLRIEQLVAAKAAVPLNVRLDNLKHNAINSSDSKHDSKLVKHHDGSDYKKEHHGKADVKSNRREDADGKSSRPGFHDSDDISSDQSNSHDRLDPHSDDKRSVKLDEKNGSDGSYDSHSHNRRHQLHDDSYAPKPRDNTRWPTPSPTSSFYSTSNAYNHRDHDSADNYGVKHRDKKYNDDSIDSKDSRSHGRHHQDLNESFVTKPRVNTRKPTLPPTNTFHPTKNLHKVRDHHSANESDDRRDEEKSNDASKDGINHPRNDRDPQDETVKPKHGIRTVLPPTYSFNPTNTSRNHHDQDSPVAVNYDIKRGEKKGGDDSEESHDHSHHHRSQDESIYPKSHGNTDRPTPSPTHSVYPANKPPYRRDHNAGGKCDEFHDDKKESDDSDDIDNRHDRTHRRRIYDESNAPKPREDARRPALPPTYAFYPINKSMIISLPYQQFEEQARHRRTNTDYDSDDSDDSLDSKKDAKKDHNGSDSGDSGCSGHASTQPQHQLHPLDDERRTLQPPSDHRSPVLHTSAALPRPRRIQGPNVIEQDTAAQTPELILRVNRVNHLITL